jgi:hypothetical protein
MPMTRHRHSGVRRAGSAALPHPWGVIRIRWKSCSLDLPCGRSTGGSGGRQCHRSSHAWVCVPMRAFVSGMLQTMAGFPPRQKPASVSLDQVLEKLQTGIPGS